VSIPKPPSVPKMPAVRPTLRKTSSPKPPPVPKRPAQAPRFVKDAMEDPVGIITAVVPAIEATVAALEAKVLAEEAAEKEKASPAVPSITSEPPPASPEPGDPSSFPALAKALSYELQKAYESIPPMAAEPPVPPPPSSMRAWVRPATDRVSEPEPELPASDSHDDDDDFIIPGVGRVQARQRRITRWGARSALLACAMAGAFVFANHRRAMPGVDEKVDGAWSRANGWVGHAPPAPPPPPVVTATPDAGATPIP